MEVAKQYAKEDLERRTQEYFSAKMKEKRRKQRQVYNEAYERIDMAQQDLSLEEIHQRRQDYVEKVRKEVQEVLHSDITNRIMDYM